MPSNTSYPVHGNGIHKMMRAEGLGTSHVARPRQVEPIMVRTDDYGLRGIRAGQENDDAHRYCRR